MDIGAFISWLVQSPFICIGWIIVGAVAGALARQLMGSKDQPFISDLILGLLGALAAGFLVGLFGGIDKPEGGLPLVIVNLILATIGAAVLIFLGRVVRGRR